MARALLLTTIYIVVLTCANSERRPFLRYSKYLQKELPHHWKHDQEELGRRVDTVARGHQAAALEPLEPQEPPWRRWTKEGRQAALQPDTNKQLRNIRKRLLEKKLKPNHQSRLIIHNKKTSMEANLHRMPRVKRDLMVMKDEGAERVLGVQSSAQQQQQQQQGVRARRQVLINPVLMPEVVMQPHIQAPLQQNQETQKQQPNLNFHFYNPSIYYPEVIDALSNRTEPYQERVEQKRDKRHVLYLINKPATVYTGPRATVNPFIREANTDDYEIVRPQSPYQGPPMGPGSDVDSYHISETKNVLLEITKSLLNLEKWLKSGNQNWAMYGQVGKTRDKRSPRMSKLRKKQKLEKKKRKKKKQQKLTPRQIKHYRRIREHKEERRKILHKKLKEKRRLRHKKLGTGPYNKTIIDYYGIYFDPPSSQINESLYDSIYDTSEIDSDKAYDEQMKNYSDTKDEEDDSYEDDDEHTYEDSEEESSQIVDDSDDRKGDDEKIKRNSPNTSKGKMDVDSLDSKLHGINKQNNNNKLQQSSLMKEGIHSENTVNLESQNVRIVNVKKPIVKNYLEQKSKSIKIKNNIRQQNHHFVHNTPQKDRNHNQIIVGVESASRKKELNLINIIFENTVSINKPNKYTLNKFGSFSEYEFMTPKLPHSAIEKHTIPTFLQSQSKRHLFLL